MVKPALRTKSIGFKVGEEEYVQRDAAGRRVGGRSGSAAALFQASRERASSWTLYPRRLFGCRSQSEAYQLQRWARVRCLAAPKALIGSLHRLSRPQQQGRRSVNPFTSVPAIPACGPHVNAISGGEGGTVIVKKLKYTLASDIESPAFAPFRANPEGADRRLEGVDILLHRQKF